jgi:uncharacterized membrane protein YozB (DUF420 family)
VTLRDLPALNAGLNATTFVLLTAGFFFIKARKVTAHKCCMLAAVVVGLAFLTSYVVYHVNHGATKFTHAGWIRPTYFAILISHTALAIANVPLIVLTLWRAFHAQFDRHARIARWTIKLWWYVSVTGILVYFILYHWYPPRVD